MAFLHKGADFLNSKIIFFDIDGTLLDCVQGMAYLNETTYQALWTLKKNGHQICLATGRCYPYLHQQFLSLPFDGMILANGAHVIYHGQVLDECIIEKKQVLAVLDYCQAHQIEYVLEGQKQCVSLKYFTKMQTFFSQFAIPLENIVEEIPENFAVYKIAVIPNSIKQADEVYEAFHTQFQMMRHQDHSFDLYPQTISKGKALSHILKASRMEVAQSIAFGDGINDLEILENVGLSIAMGNASELVKAKADMICENVEQDGVVLQLKALGLLTN